MKKTMIFIILLLIPFIITYNEVEATTVGDLKKELTELENKQNEADQKKNLTQAQINSVYAMIDSLNKQINEIEEEKKKLSEEIVTLTENIEAKDKEIKDILNFVQISNGESAYLEYAFGAKSFTDFIYRVAVSEQLTSYNENLINEYNALIEQNNKKKVELNQKAIEIEQKQLESNRQLVSLGSQMEEVMDLRTTVEEQIKLQREAIDMYQNKLGCKDNEDIKTCGIKYLPEGTSFYRPIVSGYLTSEFGNRCFYLKGVWTCDFHLGIDLSTSDYAPAVYASAPGVVAGTIYRGYCGGNQVFIHHNINGVTYTTQYAHLLSMNVKVGDMVTSNTIIGYMGGNPSVTTWDTCSTGQHLHFSIATGLYLKDYYNWSTFVSRVVNPVNYLNMPSGYYSWFTSRTIKY